MTKRLSTYLMAAGGVGLLLVALAQVPGSWWRGLAAGWPVLLPVAASLAALGAGVLLRRRGAERHEPSAAPTAPDRQVRPLRSWVIPAGVAVVAVVTTAALVWLQDSVPVVGDGVQRAQLRVESIRTALTIGAAVTGAFALLLAFRRQQLAERTQQATEYDAGEKRVTELYVKAVDQLGSDKAPVRLGGLYALERLAQDNPIHRQSIVEVICAYLRMPYTPPAEEPGPSASGRPPAVDGDSASGGAAAATAGSGEPDKPERDPREERQVRLAAQRILAAHLRPKTREGHANPAYWGPEIVLDLTEAVLIKAEFADCHLHNVTFTNATFSGDAWFVGARFGGVALFDGVTVGGVAWFDGAAFGGSVRFDGATFSGAVRFDGAAFGGAARFGRATFQKAVTFDEVKFSLPPKFNEVTFLSTIRFAEALINGASYNGPSPAEL
ncbi:pentapeptide repeat-containing protein [Micromonospora sp. DT233]|uniref:pentapeptide repeat-containing protein n=1 Tax=Micromonospora sp. DT233 TaxID=3393432 RepID=UPI003CEC5362